MQNPTCHPEKTLRKHLDLCEETYAVLQKENSHLKHKQCLPDDSILEQKKQLLDKLEESNKALKVINDNESTLTPVHKALAGQVQKKIMKIFLLDRENEQFILKASIPMNKPNPAMQEKPSTPQKIKNLYQSK